MCPPECFGGQPDRDRLLQPMMAMIDQRDRMSSGDPSRGGQQPRPIDIQEIGAMRRHKGRYGLTGPAQVASEMHDIQSGFSRRSVRPAGNEINGEACGPQHT